MSEDALGAHFQAYQPSMAAPVEDDSWDDAAIMKAFRAAVTSHTCSVTVQRGPPPPQPLTQQYRQTQQPHAAGTSDRKRPSPSATTPTGPGALPSSDKRARSAEGSGAALPSASHQARASGIAGSHTMPPPQPSSHASYPPPPTTAPPLNLSMPALDPSTMGHAAMPSLGIQDEALADLLSAWYYSGYYTGRYMAMQEMSRKQGGAGASGGAASGGGGQA